MVDVAEFARAERVVIQGGIVLSMDPGVGDFVEADVVIDHGVIEAVGPRLAEGSGAVVIDAGDTIVIPGFVDTHHHCYQGILRGILPTGRVFGGSATQHGRPAPDYIEKIHGTVTPFFEPSDVHIGELITGLSSLERGITTVVDTSQVCHTPEHADACIAGLTDSGIRALFSFFDGTGNGGWPDDLRRLKSTYCASDDGLLTLALHAFLDPGHFALARDVGARVVTHYVDSDLVIELGRQGLLGPDIELIHCTMLNDEAWRVVADTGVNVSIATPIEMAMGIGVPPIQTALDRGIAPGLSSDVDTTLSQDFFGVMRSTLTLQRMNAFGAEDAGGDVPELMTSRDVLELATIGGARCAGLDHRVGSISPGKDADLVLLRTDRLGVWPVNNAVGTVVNLMDPSNVDTVMVAGTVVKWQGALVGVDEAKIRREAAQARDQVLARAGISLGILDEWDGDPSPES